MFHRESIVLAINEMLQKFQKILHTAEKKQGSRQTWKSENYQCISKFHKISGVYHGYYENYIEYKGNEGIFQHSHLIPFIYIYLLIETVFSMVFALFSKTKELMNGKSY